MISDDDSFGALVDDALACISLECPEAYRAMARALGLRRVDLFVRGEALELSFVPPRGSHVQEEERARELTELGDAPSINPAAVVIETNVSTLRDVVSGDRDALDAILADDLRVVASPEDLIHASEASLYFIKGAVRCRSMSPLLSRLECLALKERGEKP